MNPSLASRFSAWVGVTVAAGKPDPDVPFESALKKRKNQPVLVVDLAVPRDVEKEVGDLANVYLYTVDDLQQVGV